MTDNPTTKRVPWMVEAHGCKCLDCVIGFGVWRDRLATAEARVVELETDLAALMPLARWVVAPDPDAPTSSEQYAAARAVLASVEARR